MKDAGFTVTTGSWLDAYDTICADAKKQYIANLKAEAKASHQNTLSFRRQANITVAHFLTECATKLGFFDRLRHGKDNRACSRFQGERTREEN